MLTNRPPIIVVLGHVDHGKTTLLDYLRKTNVAAREAGGITQHIRSFKITNKSGKEMTFIDTPGHEAFGKMRQRGSKLADLAVLVVAADDGIKPQTTQSIQFIKESGIPMVVAINKIDLPTADADKVKTQLMEMGVIVEDAGGEIPAVSVSAKTGQGITELVDLLELVAELNPPKADNQASLEAMVLESRLDAKKGPLAVVIVKSGTVNIGQELWTEKQIGKVKALIDADGKNLAQALPSTPVEILGLTAVPEVGSLIADKKITGTGEIPAGEKREISDTQIRGKIVLRADVAGSLEAILTGLPETIQVLASGTGEVNENDLVTAKSANAQILTFNTKVPASIRKLAEIEKISIREFKIIYELFEFVLDMVLPKKQEEFLGKAEVIAVFKIDGVKIAGIKCTEGVIEKSNKIRVVRKDKTEKETRIKSLQQGKTTVDKIKAGAEGGAVFAPFVDFDLGDSIMATTG